MRPVYEVCVNGFPDLSKNLFDVYLDVLSGYVGYHSWDVTLGQVAASDFYVVSVGNLRISIQRVTEI